MQTTFRSSASRINAVVGPMVMVIGICAAIAAVVLSLVMETAAFLALLIPAVLALGGGAFVLWGARRSRLRIDAEGFVWAGFVGAQRAVRWQMVQRLMPPAPEDPRLVAMVLLRDGTQVPLQALWEPATFPVSLAGGADHSAAQNALIAAHRQWLATHR